MKLNQEYIRLLKNIGGLLLVGVIISLLIGYFASNSDSDDNKIADTPIRVESVKKIAELSVISYTDEIVVDSVEYYKELDEISDWLDAIELSERVLNRNVQRRLTLIVKGEVKFGFDLKKNPIKTKSQGDTMIIVLPEPEVIEINLTPSGTEVYQEQGYWKDKERRELENEARLILLRNSERFGLKQKAKDKAIKLLKGLLQKDTYVEVHFEP